MALKIQAPTKQDRYKRRLVSRFYDFSGGRNTSVVPQLLNDNESPDEQNVVTDDRGSLNKRNGYTKHNNTKIGDVAIDNLFKFYKSDGTEKLMCSAGQTVYWSNNGTWTAIETLASAGDIYFDTAFVAGSEYAIYSNGVNNIRKWDGTTASDLVAAPDGYLTCNHVNRLFIAGTTALPNRVYFSDLGDPTTFGVNSFIDVNPGDGDKIVWIEPLLDTLVIYKRNSVHVLYGEDADNFTLKKMPTEHGCVSGKSVAFGDNAHYYLSEDGVYRFNGSICELISEKVTPDILAMTRIQYAVGAYYNNQYWLSYTYTGGTYNNRVLMYDALWKSWWLFTGINADCFVVTSGGDDTSAMYFGSSNAVGFVYQADSGTSDAGAAIDAYWKSKQHSMGMPERKKRMRRIYVECQSQGTDYDLTFGYAKNLLTTFTSIDIPLVKTASVWDTFLWDVGKWDQDQLIIKKVTMSGNAYYLQTKFSNANASQPFTVYGYVIYWRPRGPK